nr:hypothetical protein CFP56_74487 [Quercus suber]
MESRCGVKRTLVCVMIEPKSGPGGESTGDTQVRAGTTFEVARSNATINRNPLTAMAIHGANPNPFRPRFERAIARSYARRNFGSIAAGEHIIAQFRELTTDTAYRYCTAVEYRNYNLALAHLLLLLRAKKFEKASNESAAARAELDSKVQELKSIDASCRWTPEHLPTRVFLYRKTLMDEIEDLHIAVGAFYSEIGPLDEQIATLQLSTQRTY